MSVGGDAVFSASKQQQERPLRRLLKVQAKAGTLKRHYGQ
jgi:hypothetical protein